MKSILYKIITISFVFTLINILFISFIMFANQMDLITKNTEFQARDYTKNIQNILYKLPLHSITFDATQIEKEYNELLLKNNLDTLLKNYIIFDESKRIYILRGAYKDITNTDILRGRRAISNAHLFNENVLSVIDNKTLKIHLYIPFAIKNNKLLILLTTFSMTEISNYSTSLYQVMTTSIIILILIHVIYLFFIYFVIIKPLKNLRLQSKAISEGNFFARVKITGQDEIGALGKSFNTMASYIEDKIKELKREVAQRKIAEEKYKQLSITDSLSGIFNRYMFNIRLDEYIKLKKRYKTIFSIILFDIDNFKSINDTFGHQTGDYVIKEIAHIGLRALRDSDLIARWGGEEFIILLPNTSIIPAQQVASRILHDISTCAFEQVKTVTASFGVTQFFDNDNDMTLLERVDRALYEAKHNGKNRVVTIGEEIHEDKNSN